MGTSSIKVLLVDDEPEIARMLAGSASDAAIEHAGELVEVLRLLPVRVGRAFVGEGHHTDDRQIGDAAGRRHCDGELIDPEKGLEDEQVGASPRQNRGLLRVGRWNHCAAFGFVEIEDPGQRCDRPRHQHVTTRDLARLARELDCGRIDLFSTVANPSTFHARPGAAESGGLNELGPGFDIGQMNIEHRLWMLEGGNVGIGTTTPTAAPSTP